MANKKSKSKSKASKSKVKSVLKVKIKKIVKKFTAKKPVAKKPAVKKVAQKIKVVAKKDDSKKSVATKKAKVIKPLLKKNKSNVTYMKFNREKKPEIKRVSLPANYKPSVKEEYMNATQLEYFRRKLEDWKKELLLESTETIQHLQAESWNEPDPSDQATIVEQTGLELRTRDRYRKLIAKIDAALARIDSGEYGYCEVTGDPIGLARLEARPIATMTIAAQEQHEMEERMNMEG